VVNFGRPIEMILGLYVYIVLWQNFLQILIHAVKNFLQMILGL
jgi:hypothetical protein